MSDQDIDLCLIAVLLLRRKRKRENTLKKRKKRKYWVRSIYRKREEHGIFHCLVQELRLGDREFYFR